MPITIVCKKCKRRTKLVDIPWLLRGNVKDKVFACKCGRKLV